MLIVITALASVTVWAIMGFIIASLCVAAGREDERIQRMVDERKKDNL